MKVGVCDCLFRRYIKLGCRVKLCFILSFRNVFICNCMLYDLFDIKIWLECEIILYLVDDDVK